MKIQTGNRLAHYQVELNEVNEQTIMLQNRLNFLTQEYRQLGNYLTYNNGDMQARRAFRAKEKELRGVQSQINRNRTKIMTLQRQICTEMQKIKGGR